MLVNNAGTTMDTAPDDLDGVDLVQWDRVFAVNVRTLSRVLAPEVRVNAVAPGWIAGDWMERTLGDNYDRLMERRARMTPLQANVILDDVAESIYALATSRPFVTGEAIVIDGGYTATT